MNYHNITHDDMLNGSGLRVCLWCSGCNHYCPGCQNQQTWDYNSGIPFDEDAERELFEVLARDYITGITFTGGDPLYQTNLDTILHICQKIRLTFGNSKSIWLYTGYQYEKIISDYKKMDIVKLCNVIVDGEFEQDRADVNYHWAGSTNQRVIDVQKTLESGEIILWK